MNVFVKHRNLTILVVTTVSLLVVGFVIYLNFRESQARREMRLADTLVEKASKNTAGDNFALAYRQLVQAHFYYNKYNAKKGIATVNTFMALMYYGIGQPQEFIHCLEVVKPDVDLLDANYKAMYYRINAIAQTENYRNYEAALSSIRKAIAEDKRLSDKCFFYQDMGNMAQIFLENKDFKRCEETLDKIIEDQGEPYFSQVLYCRMRMAFEQGDYSEARRFAKSCLDNSRKNHQTHLQVESLRMIKDLDRLQGNDKAYIDHYEQFVRLNDTLTGANATYRIAKTKEYYRMRIDKLNAEKKDQFTKLIVCFLLFFILAVVAILLLLLRRTHEKKRIAELESKNLEAEVKRGMLERELLKLKMEKKGRELQKSHQDNVKMSLQLATLDKSDKEMELKLFDSHFELLDSSFKKEVERQFPMITKSEMRLLCLIKLGFSAPEILSIFNISSSGLYKLRYRLRKRLGLGKRDDLEHYIENLYE